MSFSLSDTRARRASQASPAVPALKEIQGSGWGCFKKNHPHYWIIGLAEHICCWWAIKMLFVLRFVSGLRCHAILNTLKVNELFFKDSLQAVTNPLLSLSRSLSHPRPGLTNQGSHVRSPLQSALYWASAFKPDPLPLLAWFKTGYRVKRQISEGIKMQESYVFFFLSLSSFPLPGTPGCHRRAGPTCK